MSFFQPFWRYLRNSFQFYPIQKLTLGQWYWTQARCSWWAGCSAWPFCVLLKRAIGGLLQWQRHFRTWYPYRYWSHNRNGTSWSVRRPVNSFRSKHTWVPLSFCDRWSISHAHAPDAVWTRQCRKRSAYKRCRWDGTVSDRHSHLTIRSLHVAGTRSRNTISAQTECTSCWSDRCRSTVSCAYCPNVSSTGSNSPVVISIPHRGSYSLFHIISFLRLASSSSNSWNFSIFYTKSTSLFSNSIAEVFSI